MFWGKVAGLAAMAAAIAVVVVPSAGAATRICAAPGSRDWERAKPGELGLDPAKLKEALDFGDSRLSTSVLLIRRGCLAGVSRNGQVNYNTPQESFSMAKSTVALVAMRAMTLGLLSPEDRVGALIEEADAAHGDITIRQLLEMSSGLHWNFFADYGNVFNPDGVRGALLLPFDSKPGTEFEYHQAGVSLLTEAIERAVDEPFQDFVQRELFTPLGISRAQWTWDRDNVGNTRGFWGLRTSAANFGRLGLLMLRNGRWNDNQLIDPWFAEAARSRSATNPGYGWLFWRNDPDGYIGATFAARRNVQHPDLPGLPMDAYEMNGLLDQQVVIIPSLDTVYVRTGLLSSDPTLPEGTFVSEGSYSQSRKFAQAFTDPILPDTGPWVPDPPVEPVPGGRSIESSSQRLDELFAVTSTSKPPLPPAGPPRRRIPITSQGALTVGGGGRVDVPVSCPPVASLACRASFVLTTPAGRPLANRVRAAISAGDSTTLRFTVGAGGRRRLGKAPGGRLDAQVRIFVADDGGRSASSAIPPITLTAR